MFSVGYLQGGDMPKAGSREQNCYLVHLDASGVGHRDEVQHALESLFGENVGVQNSALLTAADSPCASGTFSHGPNRAIPPGRVLAALSDYTDVVSAIHHHWTDADESGEEIYESRNGEFARLITA